MKRKSLALVDGDPHYVIDPSRPALRTHASGLDEARGKAIAAIQSDLAHGVPRPQPRVIYRHGVKVADVTVDDARKALGGGR